MNHSRDVCSPQRESLRSLTNMGSYHGHLNATGNGTTNHKSILHSMSCTETKKKKRPKRKLSNDMIQLQVDNTRVMVGDAITGTIELKEDAPTSLVKLVFEGIEYTVVALIQSRDNHMGKNYLEQHTSETNVLTSQQVLADVSTASDRKQPFRFFVPNGLPGTMRCILDGSDPILPSQYTTTYTIKASIFKNTSKAEVTQSIIVSAGSKQDVRLDSLALPVSVINPVKSIASTFFQCGSTSAVHEENNDAKADPQKRAGIEEDDQEGFLDKSCQLFSLKCQQPTSHDYYCFAVGQIISLHITDWLGRQLSGIWMVQLIEEVKWCAKRRTAASVSKWNLFANHHELPTTLRRSYEGESSSLSIKHHLVVFLATDEEDPSREVMACSEPFPIVIVSNTRGWDA